MKRRAMLLSAVMLVLILLGGCIPSVELNQRAIVQAIGVDAAEDGYRVTLQIFFPDGGGDSGIDPSKQNAKIISAEGKTISDAIQAATFKQGKQIFYGHNRLLVIGEQAAKDGIREILPFFNSGYQTRPSTDVMIAEFTAAEILTANIEQGILPAESLQSMVDNYTENASVVKTRLLDIIEAIYDESKSVAIPKIKLTEESKQTQSKGEGGGEQTESVEPSHAVSMDGTAILKAEKLVGYLNSDETRGLIWLTGKVERTLVVFPYQKEDGETDTVSIEVYQSDTDTKVELQNGKPVFLAEIRAAGRVNEVGINEQLSGTEQIEGLERQAAELIRAECEAAFAKAAKEYRADVFSFGNLLLRKEKQAWSKLKERWPEAVAETELQVTVRLDIDRIGLQAGHGQ